MELCWVYEQMLVFHHFWGIEGSTGTALTSSVLVLTSGVASWNVMLMHAPPDSSGHYATFDVILNQTV